MRIILSALALAAITLASPQTPAAFCAIAGGALAGMAIGSLYCSPYRTRTVRG